MIADQEHLEEELQLLGQVFHQNGHYDREFTWVLRGSGGRRPGREEDIKELVVIPFFEAVYSCIGRLLKRINIRMVPHQPLKIGFSGGEGYKGILDPQLL